MALLVRAVWTRHLNYNRLTGSIPSSISKLNKLDLLNLDHNFLTGAIPVSLVEMTKLSLLHLCCNNLTGQIPSNISNMANLSILIIDRNGFTGPIPSLVLLPRLQKIQLGYNKLSGEPDFIYQGDLFYMPDLYVIDISHNNLTGPFPDQLSADLRPPGSAGFQIMKQILGAGEGQLHRRIHAEEVTLLPLLASTGLRYVDVSGNYLLGPLPNVSLPGVKVFTANNCFQPPAAHQRSVAFCKALPPPQCFDFRYHYPGPCDIEYYLGVDYNHSNVDPACYDSTCKAGKCTFIDVIQSRVNQSCHTPWSVDPSWNMQCLNVRCASNGSCIVMAFRDTNTACDVTGTDGCSGVFCNGKGVCNLRKNATDGAKCLLLDDYSTRYLAECRESSCQHGVCTVTKYYNSSKSCEHYEAGYGCAGTFCNGNGMCNVAKNYSDGTHCRLDDVDYEKGVCTEFFNNRTICTPPPMRVPGPYGQPQLLLLGILSSFDKDGRVATRKLTITMCTRVGRNAGFDQRSGPKLVALYLLVSGADHQIAGCLDMLLIVKFHSGTGGCDTSVPPQTAADGSRCDLHHATGCQYKTCRSSACQVVNNVADGTICSDNPNVVDGRCQISSCRNGTCSRFVGNKPAGMVCLPHPLDVGPLVGWIANYITGTCESAECCARCDGAGNCDRDIREGQACRNCTIRPTVGAVPTDLLFAFLRLLELLELLELRRRHATHNLDTVKGTLQSEACARCSTSGLHFDYQTLALVPASKPK
eukprot:SM000362S13784  [mRNA]  locus=s362:73646:81633:+ [translate_table: standard]